ncbi:MAG: UDP-3-O-(3-hydroxymyristoyl)glucosamine N-acyltransferase [Bacteroidales bacterium]|nr:UDP-3-O-(3-hydroxymyristoyl)glucosamine N-acyltransferase [Bacteroidales bacterium]
MEFTIAQIAELISAEIEGNKDAIIKTVCKIEEGCEYGLTFLSNPKYTPYLYETKATAAIVNKDFVPEKPVPCTLIKVANSYIAFATLLNFYSEQLKKIKKGISPNAAVSPSAKIGQDVYIGDFVSIGDNVIIGDGAQIYPHVFLGDDVKIGNHTTLNSGVKVYRECVIGNNCTIHAGTVIGADGFGFAPQEDGSFLKIPQIGNVVIEDGVEIGANTCIDRATMGSTFIRKNAKIDNLVQIAHNVEVGENSAFAAQAGVAGSTKIGKNCLFGGQVGINGHITIGDHVSAGAQSGVQQPAKDGEVLFGSPANPLREEQRLIIYKKRLPDLYNRVNQLEKKLKDQENNK